MKKDAYYFPHFSNARNDAKILKLRRVLGLEGYAMYFMLLEVLREQTEFKYPISGIEDLAYEWHVSKEKIMSVISGFDLFEIDETNFFSTKLILYLQPYLEKSSRASLAARKRWEKVKNELDNVSDEYAKADAKALQMQYVSNASKVKESKVKESKENKENFVDEIYNLYPSKCNNRKTSTGKSQKDKEKIKKILQIHSFDNLKKIIENYLIECDNSKTYIKNFSTFLNNLPEYNESNIEIEKKERYQDAFGTEYFFTKSEFEKGNYNKDFIKKCPNYGTNTNN